MSESIDAHDDRKRRCPMLGHELSFAYCRQPGSPNPCRRIVGCWRETFDVEAFLTPHLTRDQTRHLAGPRPEKAATLVELIARAQQLVQHRD